MCKKILLTLCIPFFFILSFSQNTLAAEADTAHLQALHNMISQMKASEDFLAGMKWAMQGKTPTAQSRKFMKCVTDKIDMTWVKESIVSSYAKYFSTEEANEIALFFSKPEGKALHEYTYQILRDQAQGKKSSAVLDKSDEAKIMAFMDDTKSGQKLQSVGTKPLVDIQNTMTPTLKKYAESCQNK